MIADPRRVAAEKAWRHECAVRAQHERALQRHDQQVAVDHAAKERSLSQEDEVARFKNALNARRQDERAAAGKTPPPAPQAAAQPDTRLLSQAEQEARQADERSKQPAEQTTDQPIEQPTDRPADATPHTPTGKRSDTKSDKRADTKAPREARAHAHEPAHEGADQASPAVSGDEPNGSQNGSAGHDDGSDHHSRDGQGGHDDTPVPTGIFGLFASVQPTAAAPVAASPAPAVAPSTAATIAELAERVLAACDGTHEVRVQVRPEVMRGVAFSVARRGTDWLVQFEVSDPNSLRVLQDASGRLSASLARRLGRDVDLRVTAASGQEKEHA
jgi:hypothetical protein